MNTKRFFNLGFLGLVPLVVLLAGCVIHVTGAIDNEVFGEDFAVWYLLLSLASCFVLLFLGFFLNRNKYEKLVDSETGKIVKRKIETPKHTLFKIPLQFYGVLYFGLLFTVGFIGELGRSSNQESPTQAMDTPVGKTFTNSIGTEFILIPAGSFTMGADKNDKDAEDDETPPHRVSISQAFYLGKYEVTQGEWEAVMGSNPSKFKGRSNPVERVSWNDVQTFIQRLNAKEGTNKYRLPTEAEWEYAARAGTKSTYSFGDDAGQLGAYAWYDGNSGDQTHPVGQKKPNPWGLYDMHGNVYEWVNDWYNESYYSRSASTDPAGPSSGQLWVLRGGSWFSSAGSLRSANRLFSSPVYRSGSYGFRLARSLDSGTNTPQSGSATQTAAPTVKAQSSGSATSGIAGKTFTNSISTEFTLIPEGSFTMGADKNSEKAEDDETPQHRVSISQAFYLGKYEVTQGEWEAVMGSNPSKFKGRSNPVEEVSWDDVQTFIQRLNAKEGTNKYRLPTEAEWEYAARAGTKSTYSFGDDAGQLGAYAWYDGNSGDQTHPVGQKKPNPWGLYDMHGNVYEWVNDWYNESYYSRSASTDPAGPSSGQYRVLRGGCRDDSAGFLRSAYRLTNSPDYRNDSVGFRLARSLDSGTNTPQLSSSAVAKEDQDFEKLIQEFNETSKKIIEAEDAAEEAEKQVDALKSEIEGISRGEISETLLRLETLLEGYSLNRSSESAFYANKRWLDDLIKEANSAREDWFAIMDDHGRIIIRGEYRGKRLLQSELPSVYRDIYNRHKAVLQRLKQVEHTFNVGW
ncbi:hypothetical protein AGMMS50289_23540 [Betaproteobacteria bacterium]|nr:hypothetical protein AGMMS50289_23540 [Betaproteobacteria bacterium]